MWGDLISKGQFVTCPNPKHFQITKQFKSEYQYKPPRQICISKFAIPPPERSCNSYFKSVFKTRSPTIKERILDCFREKFSQEVDFV